MGSGAAIGFVFAGVLAGSVGTWFFGILGIVAGFVLPGMAVSVVAGMVPEEHDQSAGETPGPLRFACPGLRR